MGVALLIIGILLAGDAAAVGIMLDVELGVTFAAGVFLIIWGVNYKRLKNGNWFLKFLNLIFKLFLVYIAGMSCFLAVFGAMPDADYTEDYAVVLGSAVRKSQPGPALLERLKTAVDYCEKNPDAKIIVCGGKGLDENTAEANVMYTYLRDNGIEPDRITKEDKSHNTYENFRYAREVTGGKLTRAVIITNDFHIFRAKLYARLCGISAHTLGAPTKWYLIPVSYVRESLAVIKMLIYYFPKHSVL